MADYKELYFKLAAAQADAIDSLQQITQNLILAQQATEELCISAEDDTER